MDSKYLVPKINIMLNGEVVETFALKMRIIILGVHQGQLDKRKKRSISKKEGGKIVIFVNNKFNIIQKLLKLIKEFSVAAEQRSVYAKIQ